MPDNDFGYTSWGKDWVRLAQPLKMDKPEPMLPRARSIAGNGLVRTEIENTMVRATIHRGSEASVTYVELVPLSAPTIAAIAQLIPADALTLTDEHRAAIAEHGIGIAPRIARADCSCRARNERCLHYLATCYALARQVDETPWLALELQGFRSGGTTEVAGAQSHPARWTPLSSLDPAAYFEVPVA
ncbi:hypothetical protein [Nocardia acidivorans]|uniref:hypothetical protein n=1 Tax=Nocardia acidivorans TaxID=404580 RepID=UPI000836D323|nr:hypothetical protein [Nocardia acidivorans]